MTGGVRMLAMIEKGTIPFSGGVFIDTYHQSVGVLAGTIRTTVDSSSLHFVTQCVETT